jgi:hypothetical protein
MAAKEKTKTLLRNEGESFTIINNEVLDINPALTPKALAVYCQLRRRADNNSGKAFPSYLQLRKRCRLGSDRDVKNALDELVERGLLQVENRIRPETKEKTTNMYTVFNKPSKNSSDNMVEELYLLINTLLKSLSEGEGASPSGGKAATPPPEIKTLGDKFKKVKISKTNYTNLIELYGDIKVEDYINRLDAHIASSGKKYKSHYATVIKWITEDMRKEKAGTQPKINQIAS